MHARFNCEYCMGKRSQGTFIVSEGRIRQETVAADDFGTSNPRPDYHTS